MLIRVLVPSLILFASLTARLCAQVTFYLPQIANGAGIQTTFVFFNNTSSDAAVAMTLRDDTGVPLNLNIPGLEGSNGTYQFALPEAETRFFTSDGSGPVRVGLPR